MKSTSCNISISSSTALVRSVTQGAMMRPDLKLKFRVAILRHVAAEQELERSGRDPEDEETPLAPGMSFFTAVR